MSFFASALMSALSRKLPPLALPISLVPAWLSFMLYAKQVVPDHPMVYILFGLIHFAGSLIYIGQWLSDSTEYRKNSVKSYICGYIYAALAFGVWICSEKFLEEKWQILLKTPIYIIAYLGAACGILGAVWYFLTPKQERKEKNLWCAAASALLCFIVIIIRYFSNRFGII